MTVDFEKTVAFREGATEDQFTKHRATEDYFACSMVVAECEFDLKLAMLNYSEAMHMVKHGLDWSGSYEKKIPTLESDVERARLELDHWRDNANQRVDSMRANAITIPTLWWDIRTFRDPAA